MTTFARLVENISSKTETLFTVRAKRNDQHFFLTFELPSDINYFAKELIGMIFRILSDI